MHLKWKIPGGSYRTLYTDMLQQPHLLVAGATGSGKSVLVNGLIYTLLYRPHTEKQLILIDPKRVELSAYRKVPHCIAYASEPLDMVNALKKAMEITEARYKRMQKKGLKKSPDPDIYVIIDELADLMTTNRKQIEPLLQRLCQVGRAAKVHVIACTQCPLSSVIPTPIKVNFDARIGLHTRSSQDSRNILGIKGCECLPRYGKAYYMRPEGLSLENITYYTDEQLQTIIDHWTKQHRLLRAVFG